MLDPTMQRTVIVLLFLASLTSCGEPPLDTVTAEKLYYADPAEQQRLKSALKSAGVPFEVRSGIGNREEVWYESRFKGQVTQIRGEVFGVPPPKGRNISLGAEGNAALVEELKKRNASHWIATYRGQDFIAWPGERRGGRRSSPSC
jgi:hypothetical protein